MAASTELWDHPPVTVENYIGIAAMEDYIGAAAATGTEFPLAGTVRIGRPGPRTAAASEESASASVLAEATRVGLPQAEASLESTTTPVPFEPPDWTDWLPFGTGGPARVALAAALGSDLPLRPATRLLATAVFHMFDGADLGQVDSDDPLAACLARILAAGAEENAGRLDEAVALVDEALVWATAHGHIWMQALSAQQLAHLHSQMLQPDQALRYAAAASAALRQIGADSGDSDMGELVALGHLAMGRVAQARAGFTALIEAGVGQSRESLIIARLGLADTDRVDGQIAPALAMYRELAAEQRQLESQAWAYGPWTVIIEAACLGAHVLEGQPDDPLLPRVELALVKYALTLFTGGPWSVDVPVLGSACLGLGAFVIARSDCDRDRTDGLTLMALAERLASRQDLPALNRAAHWRRITQVLGPSVEDTARASLAPLELGECLARAKVLLERRRGDRT
jgi:tetratricopeptide (TPR) repeat protein